MKKQKKQKKQKNRLRHKCCRSVMVALWALPSIALADTDLTVTSILDNLTGLLTSGWARAFALLAIISVGYLTLHEGQLPKSKAISVILGIGIIFGAATIYQQLGGS